MIFIVAVLVAVGLVFFPFVFALLYLFNIFISAKVQKKRKNYD